MAAACTSGGGAATTTVVTGGTPATVPDGSTTTLDPRPCRQTSVLLPEVVDGPVPVERVPGGNPHAAAVAASQAAFLCSQHVVVVGTGDLELVAVAAGFARRLNSPLLYGEPGASSLLAYELERLAPESVWLIGADAEAPAPEWSEVRRVGSDADSAAAEVQVLLGATAPLSLPGSDAAIVATLFEALRTGGLVAPPPPPVDSGTTTEAADEPTTTTTTTLPPTDTPGQLGDLSAGDGASGAVWLVDRGEPEALIAAAVAALASAGIVATVDGADLRSDGFAARVADGVAPPRRVQVVGGGPDSDWQARVILRGDEIPGGGFLMFPEDTGRRLVALYGNPLTNALGVLGEQDAEEAVTRASEVAVGYDADGVPVLPTFEIIATVAAADAGVDGNYSNEMEVGLLREWIDVAAANDMYVLLDLQPGRIDFLTQAMLYEELLLEPHVGLALDPEWRLGPEQFHLEQIGTVTAEEVNTVVDWLAALVRDNALPQKMLLLHQFRISMLQNREQISTPTELAVVIQMDGQGAISDKYGTWSAITDGWESYGWDYGWKNFFDEDIPGPILADEILRLSPTVVYVSYQ